MLTQEEIAKLQSEAEIELKKYPGVLGVGWAYKQTGGEITDEVGFRVLVAEKKKKSELKPEDILPTEFKGIPIDVMTIPLGEPLQCGDTQYHSPLIGGITVSNQRLRPDNRPEVGTLGFFATMAGQPTRDNVFLVSNNHVLMAVQASVNDAVYQTEWVIQGGVAVVDLRMEQLHPIGKIHNAGLQNNHPFTFPGESQAQYGVDCAMAKLDISISSWCDTNCGVSYKNEIRGLNIRGNNTIASVANVRQAQVQSGSPNYVVYKVGQATDRTVGRVTAVNTSIAIPGGTVLQNCMEILATGNNCLGNPDFADHGDSGAALINDQNQLVGLVFSRDPANHSIGHACHIGPVLDLLQITPITAANPPVAPAGRLLSDLPGVVTDGVDHLPALKQRLLNTERGRQVFDLALAHRFEIVKLVNECRPVTVAWHRNKGPAFLGHLMSNARNPEHVVPGEIEGVTRDTMVRNLTGALLAHGSPELRQVIACHFDEGVAQLDRFDSLHELVAHVEEFDLDSLITVSADGK